MLSKMARLPHGKTTMVGQIVSTRQLIPHVASRDGEAVLPPIPVSTVGVITNRVQGSSQFVVDLGDRFGEVVVSGKALALLDHEAIEDLAIDAGDTLLEIIAALRVQTRTQHDLICDQQARIGNLEQQASHLQASRDRIERELGEHLDQEVARADGLQQQCDGLAQALMAIHDVRDGTILWTEGKPGDERYVQSGWTFAGARTDPETDEALAWVWFQTDPRSSGDGC